MNHASLFSGIGGFDLAAQWMGWNNIFQVEWDAWCRSILAKNFPDTLRFGDIVEFNKMLQNGEIITDTNSNRWSNGEKRESKAKSKGREKLTNINEDSRMGSSRIITIPSIDILTGGFPCQPFSHAGKRKGTDDSRYLWPEMLTTIRILKPTFVVGENVAGLVSMDNGKTLDGILSDLENEGYQTESFIIPACGVGAWHRRDRIWIVAYSNNMRSSTGHREIQGEDGEVQQRDNDAKSSNSSNVPDTKSERLERENNSGSKKERRSNIWGHTPRQGFEITSDFWSAEPAVGRVAHGIPNRVDRLKGLGNSIVPHVAFEIFKHINTMYYGKANIIRLL